MHCCTHAHSCVNCVSILLPPSIMNNCNVCPSPSPITCFAGTEYSVQGYAVINGQQKQLANTAVLQQPPADAPVLIEAAELSSTTATATAAAPTGVTYSRVSCVAQQAFVHGC